MSEFDGKLTFFLLENSMIDIKNVHDTFQRHAKLKIRCKILHKPESISFSGTCDLLLLRTTGVLVITHSLNFMKLIRKSVESFGNIFDLTKMAMCCVGKKRFWRFCVKRWCAWDCVRGVLVLWCL